MEVCVSGFQCFVQIFPASSVVVLVMHLSKSRIIKYCKNVHLAVYCSLYFWRKAASAKSSTCTSGNVMHIYIGIYTSSRLIQIHVNVLKNQFPSNIIHLQ